MKYSNDDQSSTHEFDIEYLRKNLFKTDDIDLEDVLDLIQGGKCRMGAEVPAAPARHLTVFLGAGCLHLPPLVFDTIIRTKRVACCRILRIVKRSNVIRNEGIKTLHVAT